MGPPPLPESSKCLGVLHLPSPPPAHLLGCDTDNEESLTLHKSLQIADEADTSSESAALLTYPALSLSCSSHVLTSFFLKKSQGPESLIQDMILGETKFKTVSVRNGPRKHSKDEIPEWDHTLEDRNDSVTGVYRPWRTVALQLPNLSLMVN